MTRIDAHQHFWPDPTLADYPWMIDEVAAIRRPFGPADLAPLLAANAIDRSVLVQARGSVSETETLLATAAEVAFVAGVVGWVDLTSPRVADDIARLRAAVGGDRLVGIRHQVQDEPDAEWLGRSDVRRGIAAVGEAGLVYDLLVLTRELPAALETVRALPDVPFVIDHLAKPPIRQGRDGQERWAAAIRPFATERNVWAKFSGLVTEADWSGWTPEDLAFASRTAVDVFGPDRLLFGSDWPVSLLAASYDRVVEAATTALRSAGLDDNELEKVFGPNAISLYRLTTS